MRKDIEISIFGAFHNLDAPVKEWFECRVAERRADRVRSYLENPYHVPAVFCAGALWSLPIAGGSGRCPAESPHAVCLGCK